MYVLLLGSGGREHAFAWKLAQSPLLKKLFIAPGNAGTAQHGKNMPKIAVSDFPAIRQFCIEEKIDLVVVGPEDPLILGIYDFFQTEPELKNIPVIGPSKAGAMLEGSKLFGKDFMKRNGIPTAPFVKVTAEIFDDGIEAIRQGIAPFVLKADGNALGKGVIICERSHHAETELKAMVKGKKFGEASSTVLIERFLKGTEFSVFVLTDGVSYKTLPVAKDYKRIGEGDTGLNTGGMGAVSFDGLVSDELMKKVEGQIIIPTIAGLRRENIVYKGFIYIGLMNVGGNPYVIEYNCRMGDPETEVVFPRIKSDLLAHLVALASGNLKDEVIQVDPRACAAVVVASGGYPENYEKGKVISLPQTGDDTVIFHAGTKYEDRNGSSELVTSGGRVLAIASFGKNIGEAVTNSNAVVEEVYFEKMYYRKDIGNEFMVQPA